MRFNLIRNNPSFTYLRQFISTLLFYSRKSWKNKSLVKINWFTVVMPLVSFIKFRRCIFGGFLIIIKVSHDQIFWSLKDWYLLMSINIFRMTLRMSWLYCLSYPMKMMSQMQISSEMDLNLNCSLIPTSYSWQRGIG